MRSFLMASVMCVAAVSSLVGCGGGNAEEPKTAQAKASLELAPIDELKSIPKDLEAELATVTRPIDEVQAIVDDLGKLPEKHKLNKSQLVALAKASFENGKVEVKLDVDLAAEAKAEIETYLKRITAVVAELKATPDKIAGLTKKVASATARVPVLATKVTASATATVSNPFGDASAKAKAQADLDGVKKVQGDVMKSVNDVQAKLAGIPEMATKALAKLTASFST
jgi:prefoldin subunit 5